MKIVNVLILFILVSCSSKIELVEVSGNTMGTYYKVKTYTDESPENVKKEVDKLLKLFNDIFSTYIPTSELSLINNSEFKRFELSKPLKRVFIISQDIFRKSGGYFDITVGPLVNAWGFGPNGKQKKPSKAQLQELMDSIGFHNIELKDKILRFSKENTYIDMSAIAKGFAVDEITKFLEFNGHQNMLVEIGGEVRTTGTKLDGSSWRLGIEGPGDSLGAKISKVIPLNSKSLATSGSYRNFVKYGEEVFNHTIDPKTGYPVKHQTISVSVISDYCADADAWATALMSMGAKKGLDLANKQNLAVYFQVLEKNSIKVLKSREFVKYMNSNKGKL